MVCKGLIRKRKIEQQEQSFSEINNGLQYPFGIFNISNSAHGVVFSMQHYVIKFVSDLRQVGGFLLKYRKYNG
jgi:hypothetical protein